MNESYETGNGKGHIPPAMVLADEALGEAIRQVYSKAIVERVVSEIAELLSHRLVHSVASLVIAKITDEMAEKMADCVVAKVEKIAINKISDNISANVKQSVASTVKDVMAIGSALKRQEDSKAILSIDIKAMLAKLRLRSDIDAVKEERIRLAIVDMGELVCSLAQLRWSRDVDTRLTLREMGDRFGVTNTRASQIERKALRELKGFL